jgi:ATP-dependent protease Clp ATPase subunit
MYTGVVPCILSGNWYRKWHQLLQQYYSKTANPWFEAIKVNRRVMVMIKRLRSGHTSLEQSLAKQGTVPSAVCDCGTAIETAEHIF